MSNTVVPAAGQKLDYINGLRAIAILGVIWHHYAAFWFNPVDNNVNMVSPVMGWPIDFAFFPMSGWLGVNLFFFLSGFVLFLPYANGSREISTLKQAGAFLWRRAKRLLPLYYLGGFVCFALFFRHYIPQSGDWFAAWPGFLTATYIFDPATFMPKFNWVYWSLGIEIWFSVLFPLLAFGLRRFPLWPVLLVSSALSVWLRWEAHKIVGPEPITPQSDNLIHRLPDFLFGMMAAKIFVLGSWAPVLRSYATGLIGLVLIIVGMAGFHHWDQSKLPLSWGSWMPLVINSGFFLFTLFLIMRRPISFALLRLWPMQIIGMMCYSIYVWHGVVISGVNVNTFEERIVYLPAYLVAMIGISLASYVFVEFPKTSWRELFLIPDNWRLPSLKRQPRASNPPGAEEAVTAP